ncbi:hypothetical protein AAU57_06585 [Nonlabens sp. YIK11]|nr:hypothetical protein AAU57_06585 [Nonlabens sp. YIK11]
MEFLGGNVVVLAELGDGELLVFLFAQGVLGEFDAPVGGLFGNAKNSHHILYLDDESFAM